MKGGMSQLESMRLQRDQRENAISAPLQAEIKRAAVLVAGLRSTVKTMEEFMGKEIAKHLMEQVGRELSGVLRREILKAVSVASGPFEPITIKLDPNTIRFMDPSSIERRVLEEYRERIMPNVAVSIVRSPAEICSTVVDIRLPQLGFRQVISDRF